MAKGKGKKRQRQDSIPSKPSKKDVVQDLPIVQQRSEIISAVQSNQVTIVVGETGSGKTTQIPQFLYKAGLHKRGWIGVTQPRRVAAVTVARRVANEMSVEIGELVGYSIRFDDKTTKSTRIKYLTDGLLLREAMADPELKGYSIIILDEVHERSLHTDILLGLLKTALPKRPDLKVIVMSATVQARRGMLKRGTSNRAFPTAPHGLLAKGCSTHTMGQMSVTNIGDT